MTIIMSGVEGFVGGEDVVFNDMFNNMCMDLDAYFLQIWLKAIGLCSSLLSSLEEIEEVDS